MVSEESATIADMNPRLQPDHPIKEETIDLRSHEMFPTLCTVHGVAESVPAQKPSWGSRPVEALVRKAGITQVFQMPFEQQKKVRPDSMSLAQLCEQVSKETNTSIDASRSGQSQTYTFVIRGSEAEITAARRRIWSEMAETAKISLDIPEDCLGIVIGPSGKTITKIMKEASAKVNVPKPYAGQVIISGDFEGISMAKQRIELLIHDKVSKMTTSVVFERYLAPFVFGNGTNSKIASVANEFAEKWGIKVNISGLKDSDMVTLALSGDKKSILPAREELLVKIEDVKKVIKSVSTKVTKNLHRFIIGSKGEALRALEAETGCYIAIPAPNVESELITLYGNDESILKGLQAILERTSSIDSIKLTADEPLRLLCLHRSPRLLKDLESKYAVRIHSSTTGFTIDGKKAEVSMAAIELQSALDELAQYEYDTVVIDAAYVKFVIGKKGQTVQQIQKEFGVDVIINSDVILVAAPTSAAVNSAKGQIMKMVTNVADLRTIEVKVDNKFHGSIKRLCEMYPTILFTFRNNQLKIHGPSERVSDAQSEILKATESLKHDAIMQSFFGELILTPEFLRVATDAEGRLNRSLISLAREHKVHNLELIDGKPKKIGFQGLRRDVEGFRGLLEDFLKRMADRSTESFEIDREYHPILIGKQGHRVKHLTRKYNVELTFPKDEKISTIVISGPRSNIKNTIEEIREFIEYEKAQDNIETITVTEESIPAILGRAGTVMASIKTATDTRINLNKKSDQDGNRLITIKGSIEGINEAKKKILAVTNDLWVSEEVSLGDECFKNLMKHGKGVIRALSIQIEEMGGSLRIDRERGCVVIRGKKDNIQELFDHVKEFLSKDLVVDTVRIPSKYHREIIGPGGENVKKLSASHSVSISISKSGKSEVVIKGFSSDVSSVKNALSKYVQVSESVETPREDHQEIMDKLSSDMKDLSVTVESRGNRLLVIGESSVIVSEIVKKIREFEAELMASTVTITVPLQFHGAIIGRAGLNIESLRNKTGCTIIIPKAGSKSDQVLLRGSSEAVSKATEAINLICSK